MLGKFFGCNVFGICLKELGFDLSDMELNNVFICFKEVVDKCKEIIDWDLEVIVNDEIC